MKTVWTFAIAFLVTCTICCTIQAQTPVGLGVRLNPDGGGLDGKFFLNKNWAIEGQINVSDGIYSSDDGPSATVAALLEYHIIFPDPSWRLYFGPGLHAGSWERYGNDYYYDYYTRTATQGIFGIDGILGLEYVFKHMPLGLSVDIQPAINLAPDMAFFPNNFFGVSGRYYFGNRLFYHRKPAQGTQM